MTADVAISELYWTPKVMGYFFRSQAIETFDEVMRNVTDRDRALDIIDEKFSTLDECESYFYDESVEDIINHLGLPSIEDDEDEE